MKLENNKDVIQSYIMTTAKYDFSVYEKRILYRIVEMFQWTLEGKKLSGKFSLHKNLFDERVVTMPISAFLTDEKDQNYARVKQALRDLRNKTFEFEDNKKWKLVGIIEKPSFDKSGFVEFEIQTEVFHAMVDFSKGYRKYELEVAMSFDSTYAMRFYELFSGQKRPISYRIEHLKLMFGIENKYKLNSDFIRYVIMPAKKELDCKSPFSFEFEPIKNGRKIESIKFYPIEIPENRDRELETRALVRKTALSWDLDKMTIDYLIQNFGFDKKEINNNRELFVKAENELDLILELSRLRTKCEGKDNPKGYVIGTLKRMLKKR